MYFWQISVTNGTNFHGGLHYYGVIQFDGSDVSIISLIKNFRPPLIGINIYRLLNFGNGKAMTNIG